MTQAKQRVGILLILAIASAITLGFRAPKTEAQVSDMRLAQNPPNQSDNTGPNVGDIPAPTGIDGSSTDIIFNLDNFELLRSVVSDPTDGEVIANDIAQALNDAYAQCQASIEQAENQPRRFARGATSTAACTSPACDRLNRLMSETEQFLSTQSQLREEIRLRSEDRLW